jgi:hypothetical protein
VFALHGNIAIGYCVTCEQSGLGMVRRPCGGCGKPYQASKLLFPVEHKDYISDPFINREWRAMKHFCVLMSAEARAPQGWLEGADRGARTSLPGAELLRGQAARSRLEL